MYFSTILKIIVWVFARNLLKSGKLKFFKKSFSFELELEEVNFKNWMFLENKSFEIISIFKMSSTQIVEFFNEIILSNNFVFLDLIKNYYLHYCYWYCLCL